MRRDEAFFEGRELELVHVARKLREALRIEELFTGAGVEYLVRADRYRATLFFFPVERVGAFFYVLPADAASCRELVAANGFQPVEVEE